jgi:hypothetical protein
MQDLVPHLPQFLDDAPLGFRRFLHIPARILNNGQHRLHFGLQLRVFPEPPQEAPFGGSDFLLVRPDLVPFGHGNLLNFLKRSGMGSPGSGLTHTYLFDSDQNVQYKRLGEPAQTPPTSRLA